MSQCERAGCGRAAVLAMRDAATKAHLAAVCSERCGHAMRNDVAAVCAGLDGLQLIGPKRAADDDAAPSAEDAPANDGASSAAKRPVVAVPRGEYQRRMRDLVRAAKWMLLVIDLERRPHEQWPETLHGIATIGARLDDPRVLASQLGEALHEVFVIMTNIVAGNAYNMGVVPVRLQALRDVAEQDYEDVTVREGPLFYYDVPLEDSVAHSVGFDDYLISWKQRDDPSEDDYSVFAPGEGWVPVDHTLDLHQFIKTHVAHISQTWVWTDFTGALWRLSSPTTLIRHNLDGSTNGFSNWSGLRPSSFSGDWIVAWTEFGVERYEIDQTRQTIMEPSSLAIPFPARLLHVSHTGGIWFADDSSVHYWDGVGLGEPVVNARGARQITGIKTIDVYFRVRVLVEVRSGVWACGKRHAVLLHHRALPPNPQLQPAPSRPLSAGERADLRDFAQRLLSAADLAAGLDQAPAAQVVRRLWQIGGELDARQRIGGLVDDAIRALLAEMGNLLAGRPYAQPSAIPGLAAKMKQARSIMWRAKRHADFGPVAPWMSDLTEMVSRRNYLVLVDTPYSKGRFTTEKTILEHPAVTASGDVDSYAAYILGTEPPVPGFPEFVDRVTGLVSYPMGAPPAGRAITPELWETWQAAADRWDAAEPGPDTPAGVEPRGENPWRRKLNQAMTTTTGFNAALWPRLRKSDAVAGCRNFFVAIELKTVPNMAQITVFDLRTKTNVVWDWPLPSPDFVQRKPLVDAAVTSNGVIWLLFGLRMYLFTVGGAAILTHRLVYSPVLELATQVEMVATNNIVWVIFDGPEMWSARIEGWALVDPATGEPDLYSPPVAPKEANDDRY